MRLGAGPAAYLDSLRAYWLSAPNTASFDALCRAAGATTTPQRTHVSDALQWLQRRGECHYCGHKTWARGPKSEPQEAPAVTPEPVQPRLPMPALVHCPLCHGSMTPDSLAAMVREGRVTLTIR